MAKKQAVKKTVKKVARKSKKAARRVATTPKRQHDIRLSLESGVPLKYGGKVVKRLVITACDRDRPHTARKLRALVGTGNDVDRLEFDVGDTGALVACLIDDPHNVRSPLGSGKLTITIKPIT